MTSPTEPTPSTAVAPDAQDLSGRQLGDYRVLRRLGRGGMADVYLAEQMSLRRQVALKVLHTELAKDGNYVKRFHFEAQAAASLVHANIVQIHEVGQLDGLHFIAQEYVPGMNLREWLNRKGTTDVKMSVLILRQVAAALQRASEQGIVHRDIKPDNIMLTQSGEVKVADFGLARVSGNDGVNITQVGVTMGTPLYMSPEQVEGKSLDTRSDIYSLGITSYHMLTGEPPFRAETALGVAVQHLNSQAERLEKIRPDLPAGLCRIIHKMLAKDPKDRYASSRDLLKDLRALQGEGIGDIWPEDLADWSPAELSALHARCEATQQLDRLMKTEALILRRTPWLRYAAFGVVAAFLIGGVAAYATRERFLLTPREASQLRVERKVTAEAQYLLASWSGNTEEAWRAVIDYFPNDKTYTPRAKQQLARLYLQRDDYARALTYFDEFAAYDAVEAEYRAFGLGGRVVVYSVQGQPQESNRVLVDLKPLRDRLDRKLAEQVVTAVKKNQAALKLGDADEWEQWFAKKFR